MKNDALMIRTACFEDAEKLLSIYEYYVKNTAVTFEWETPSLEEFQGRMKSVLGKFPYIVCEIDGEIVGYAYAAPFRVRAGYGRAVETTVYVNKDTRSKGIGGRLYAALEQILKMQNIINLNACIAYSEEEDKFLTHSSPDFHAHLGYRYAGRFIKCAYKFNRWYDMIWMEKIIGEHVDFPPEPAAFDTVRSRVKAELGIE